MTIIQYGIYSSLYNATTFIFFYLKSYMHILARQYKQHSLLDAQSLIQWAVCTCHTTRAHKDGESARLEF